MKRPLHAGSRSRRLLGDELASRCRYGERVKKQSLLAPVGVSLIALSLTFTACSVEAAPQAFAPSASALPTPTPTNPAVGAVVDSQQAADINRDWQGQFRAYAMPDGTNVVIDKTAPLPDVVQADVNRQGAEYANTYVADVGGNQMLRDRESLMGRVAYNTGKRTIMVVRLDSYLTADAETRTTNYFYNGSGPKPDGVFRNREQIVQNLNEWFAAQPNPNDFAVIWPD